MFIESGNGGYWNLSVCVNYRRDKNGVLHLVFPVPAGGNLKVKLDHPQYQQIQRYLWGATLAPDSNPL